MTKVIVTAMFCLLLCTAALMAGVNAELMPAVRMTYPRGYVRLDRVPI